MGVSESYTPTEWRSNETALSAVNLNHMEDGIDKATKMAEDVTADISGIFDKIYPVGSIYMSVSNNNPALLFGGTWEQIQDKFILACGSTYGPGTSGGNATHTHTTGNHALTIAEMPAHNHGAKLGTLSWRNNSRHTANSANKISNLIGSGVTRTASGDTQYYSLSGRSSQTNQYDTVNLALSHTHNTQGSGNAHNHGNTGSASNIPPYLAVYVWKRIAL